MIFTAYCDESGTHDGSKVTVMGAVLANARRWRQIELEFCRLKRIHNFRVFHTKKFRRRSGDFKGWTDWAGDAADDHTGFGER